MKDHEIAAIHNEVRDIAIKYHGHQCLRELMIKAIRPLVLELKKREDEFVNSFCRHEKWEGIGSSEMEGHIRAKCYDCHQEFNKPSRLG